jgi:hypothetical protein
MPSTPDIFLHRGKCAGQKLSAGVPRKVCGVLVGLDRFKGLLPVKNGVSLVGNRTNLSDAQAKGVVAANREAADAFAAVYGLSSFFEQQVMCVRTARRPDRCSCRRQARHEAQDAWVEGSRATIGLPVVLGLLRRGGPCLVGHHGQTTAISSRRPDDAQQHARERA